MDHCPHCSQKLMYGDNPLIHVIRKMTGSHKRYCPECGRKWFGRSRATNNGGVFLFVLLSGITVMFGLFQVTGSISFSPRPSNDLSAMASLGGGKMYQKTLQSLSSNPMVQEEMKRMGVNPAQAMAKLRELKNNPSAMAKLKKLQDNPGALAAMKGIPGGAAKLGNYDPAMVEKAMKYMERRQQ